MKSFVYTVAAIAAVFSTSSFARPPSGSLTRAQVEQQLVQLEQVGYRTSTHDSDYPREIQAAEAKVQALNDANATSANQVSAAGSSGAKGRQTPAGVQ